MKSKYPYKVYGKEIKEGYDTPCFFTEIFDKGSRSETRNFARGGFSIKITYFQDEKNETDQLRKVDEIKELFGMCLAVGDRRLTVGEYSHEFIGEYSDILQISIQVDYKENMSKAETAVTAEAIQVEITQG